ncbi:MAG TPA: hypothetical protein VFU02_24945 [Polyangiaceae bacterium]|nr:hypothetical protein [Polyangiaceae bacterium]
MTEPPVDNYYAPPTTDTSFTPTLGATIHREGQAVVVPAGYSDRPAGLSRLLGGDYRHVVGASVLATRRASGSA